MNKLNTVRVHCNVLRTGRVILGILFFVGAVFMWILADDADSLKGSAEFCNAGWGGMFGTWGATECIKIQVIYYSPWLLGIIGIICIAKSRDEVSYGYRY